MHTIFGNLLNGNLTAAKQAAGRQSWRAIYRHARHFLGWSEPLATAAADYLKGLGTFQAYCDAI